MPCTFSKPVNAGGATPSLAGCTLETERNTFLLSPSPLPHEVGQQQISPDGFGARLSVLFPLFRRCCPRRTLKRLVTAGSALVLCSSCNLMTPTLLGVAVDAAAASHRKARTAATVISSGAAAANRATTAAADSGTLTTFAKAATDAAAAATQITAAVGDALPVKAGLLKEIWHALRLFFSGGGRAALQQQPPRVLFALVCAVVLLGAAMSWLRTTQLETAEQELRAEVRRQLYSALLYAPPSFLFCRTNPGLLLPLFREDTDTLVAAFSSTQAQALRYCSSAFGGSALLLLLSPRLTAVALVLLPLAGCSAMLLAKRQRALQRERDAVWQQCNALLADRLLHMPTVYIHQEQEQEEYRFEQQQLQLLTTAKRAAFANGLFYGGLSFLVNSTVVALLVLGTKLVASGAMTQGSLTTFAVYSSMVGVGCSGLAALSGDISRAAAAGARISAIFAATAGGTETTAGEPPPAGAAAAGGAQAAKECAAGKKEEMADLQHQTVKIEEEEDEQQEAKQLQQVDTSEAVAGTSVLPQLLQQLEQGQLTAAEVARRMQGEIQFHNVTYLYQQESPSSAATAPAAAVLDPLSADHAGAVLSEGTAGALAQRQQQGEEQQQQQQQEDTRGGGAGTGDSAEKEGKDAVQGGVKNINLIIAAGSITGIAGASGSGKSTLLKLLTKQLKPQTGRITLDGVDTQKIPTQLLLQHLLGVVSADSVALLSGLSIRENILYGVWNPQQQQQNRSRGEGYDSSRVKQVETCRSHAATAHATAAASPLIQSGGCPFLWAKAAAKQICFSRFFPAAAAAQSPALSTATTRSAAGASRAALGAAWGGTSPAASSDAAVWSQQQQRHELLFREACRLCSISEFLQHRRFPFGPAAAAVATASANQSSASSSCVSASSGSYVSDGSSSSKERRKVDKDSSEQAAAATAFSSGELQRLGIARALVKQPAVLLLDEATAHLDERNERLLLTTLRKLVSGKKKAAHVQRTRNSSSSDSKMSSGSLPEANEGAAEDREAGGSAALSNRERKMLSPLEAATRTATPASESTSPRRRGNEDWPSLPGASGGVALARGKDGEGEARGGEEQPGGEDQLQHESSLLLEEGVRTILLIAHSKQALKLADKVVVLRKGRLAEEGTYDGLLQRRDGELARLVHRQEQQEEAEGEAQE